MPRDVYALLAQANLLRMRGCWDEAVDRCMAALRLSPNSSSAQSLLGDIYENQGRYDDAAQWYRMALDVNPHSPADQMKLELLRRHQEPRESGVTAAAEIPASKKQTGLWERLRNPETALRYGAATAALLLVFVVGLAYASTHRHGALAGLGLAPEQEVHLQPVVVPQAAPDASSPAPLHDPAEQALLDALRNSPDVLAQGIIVDDVQSDPRVSRLVLTFHVPSPVGGMTRTLTVQAAARLLQSAASLPTAQSATLFTVRCLAQTGDASRAPALIFVGDLPRASIPAADAALPETQREALFANPWWSPQMPN